MNPALLKIDHKLEKRQWRYSFPIWSHCHLFLTSFYFSSQIVKYWSKFSVNIITGFGVMTILFLWGTQRNRNTAIENNLVWILTKIWRLGELVILNLTWISLIKNYLTLQNARFTAFIVSELLKENQQGGKSTPKD